MLIQISHHIIERLTPTTPTLAIKGNRYLARLQVILSADDIKAAVERLARQLSNDYGNTNPLLLGVLKGCFVFMADLVRSVNIAVEVEFVTLSSYGPGRKDTSGNVAVIQGLCAAIKDRHVVIVEDIVDTGHTLRFVLDYLQQRKPASLKVCALFDKPARHQVEVPIDYLGFTLPDSFVVGYGLDYDERYRHLPALYVFEEDR